MVKVTQPNNLPSTSTAWARQVTDGVNDTDRRLQSFLDDQGNFNRATASNAAILTNNNLTLTNQVTELQGLLTISTQGSDYLVDNIPGDQTNRWSFGDSSTTVTTYVPTGRLLVAFGCGSIETRAGNSTMYALLRVVLTAPSGWTTQLGSNTRIFVTSGTIMGIPVTSERTFDGVPTDEPITVQVQFGTWSAADGPLASAAFLTPYVRAQVVRSDVFTI